MIKTKRFWIHLFILILPFLVFYWQMPFVGDLTIGNDYVAFPIQHQMELQYSLVHGSFPLYVPGFAWGQSAAALTLGQLYHPISHLSAAMPGYWSGYALEWNTFFRLLSLGLVHLVLFLLLIRLGLAGLSAFFISFITVYNLRMLDLFRYGASLENYTGYLLLCGVMALYYLKPSRFVGPAGIAGATYLLICGGHPQMMYLGLLGAGVAGLIIPFAVDQIRGTERRDWAHIFKYFRTVAICVLCGILLASVYIVPFYVDFVKNNAQRAGQDYQWATGYACSVGGMLNNFVSPLESEVQAAFGSSPIVLFVVLLPFLYLFRIKVPASMLGIWGISVLVFLCGLGQATPVHYYFWKYFPMAKNFRIPGRITMLFPFLFLLVFAWLFRRVKKSDGTIDLPGLSTQKMLTILSVVVMVVYVAILKGLLPEANTYAPRDIAPLPGWLGVMGVVLGGITLVAVFLSSLELSKRKPGLLKVIGIVIVSAIAVQGMMQFRYGTWVIEKHKKPTLAKMDENKQRRLHFFGDPGFGMETAIASRHKKRSTMATDIAMFYRDYLYTPDEKMTAYFFALEDSAGRAVIEYPEISDCQGKESGIRPVKQVSQQKGQAETVANREGKDRVEMTYSSFNRVEFSVTAGAPGYFVLGYPFSRQGHWVATADGKKATIRKANGYMQGVFLEPGDHRVEFRYKSAAMGWSMAISCVTFLAMGLYFALFVFTGKKRLAVLAVAVLLPVSVFVWWHSGLRSGDNMNTQYTWTTDRFPEKGNLAYGKHTLMLYGSYHRYSGYAVDGVVGKAATTLPRTKGWWQVDLGEVKELGEIRIYDEIKNTNRVLPLEILGSSNGKTFTPLFTGKSRGTQMPWRIPVEGKRARVIRIQPSKKKSFALKEVEVFPPANEAEERRALIRRVLENGKSIDVWNRQAAQPAEVSPLLKDLGKRGVFEMSFETGQPGEDALLRVIHLKPGKDNRRAFNLGYDLKEMGVIGDNWKVYFIVKAKIKGFYIHKSNYFFIQDFTGAWEKQTRRFHGNSWDIYVIEKTIRQGCTKINAGIRFTPVSCDNQLLIKDIRIVAVPPATHP